MIDCITARLALQRWALGGAPTSADANLALEHLAGCESCSAAGDTADPIACAEHDDDFAAYAAALHDRSEAAARWPALAAHLESCAECAASMEDLMREPESTPANAPRVDPQKLFARALEAGLRDHDEIVRVRSAERLAMLGQGPMLGHREASGRDSAADTVGRVESTFAAGGRRVAAHAAPVGGTDGTSPRDYQRIGLVATSTLRQGPTSPFAALIRELTPYLLEHTPHLYALDGAYRTILSTGLLRGYPAERLHCLAPGRRGGMVDLGAALVGDDVTGLEAAFGAEYNEAASMLGLDYELDCVIYLIDPVEATGVLPATLTLKREATVASKPLLDSFPIAVEWFGLLGLVAGGATTEAHLLDDELRAGLGYDAFPHRCIALVAPDTEKAELFDFVGEHVAFLQRFRTRVATRATASLLNGDSATRQLPPATLEAAARMRESLSAAGIEGEWVVGLKSGNQGGYLQIAESVMMGLIDCVVFLRDQKVADAQPGPELLERAGLIANHGDRLSDADGPMLLRNVRSARIWARLWGSVPKGESPATLTSAFRERLGVQLVLAERKDTERQQWDAIAEEAAWYLISLLATKQAGPRSAPWRVTVACGSAMSKVLRKIREPIAFDFVKRINADHERHAAAVAKCKARFPDAARNIDRIAGRRKLTLKASASEPALLWSIGPVCVAPMVGMFGSARRSVEANNNAELLAEIVDGQALSLATSAYVRGAEDVPDVIVKHWQKTDVLLVACDDLAPHWFGEHGRVMLPGGMWDDLLSKHAVGEVAGLYLDAEGKQIVPEGYIRQGMSLSDMTSVAERTDGAAAIMVAGASSSVDDSLPRRVVTTLAALRAGAVSVLVTDPAFARALLREHVLRVTVTRRA